MNKHQIAQLIGIPCVFLPICYRYLAGPAETWISSAVEIGLTLFGTVLLCWVYYDRWQQSK